MKKKFMILFFLLLFSTGCTNINHANYETIISENLKTVIPTVNTYRSGYNYYKPKGLRFLYENNGNEVFIEKDNYYYLYVDRVSYYHKKREEYKEKLDVEFSKKLENGDKFGYLEVKKTTNEKYFIEIMYNYAKIEVIVPIEEVKETIAYSLSILTSIQYQDTVLKSLMEENAFNASEVVYNIFETANTESGYLQIAEEYGQYQEEETVDPDFIRR